MRDKYKLNNKNAINSYHNLPVLRAECAKLCREIGNLQRKYERISQEIEYVSGITEVYEGYALSVSKHSSESFWISSLFSDRETTVYLNAHTKKGWIIRYKIGFGVHQKEFLSERRDYKRDEAIKIAKDWIVEGCKQERGDK